MNDVEISRLMDSTWLEHGAHRRRENGMCAMELVAYIAGEAHGYEPDCASALLTGYTIRLNDSMRPVEREGLRPFLPRLVGTSAGDEQRRFEAMARMMLTRLFAPALERRGAVVLAARLRERSRAPLGELALWLRNLSKADPNIRTGVVMSRHVRRAFWLAVNAAERVRHGERPNWNWCGGELGLAVADASRLADDFGWAVALQILEAGIDACPVGQFGDDATLDDNLELTRAARYFSI